MFGSMCGPRSAPSSVVDMSWSLDDVVDGVTPLMAAARGDDLEGVAVLLAAGADVNATNEEGDTALILACRAGNAGIVKLLLQHNADVHAENDQGSSALTACRDTSNLYVMHHVLAHCT